MGQYIRPIPFDTSTAPTKGILVTVSPESARQVRYAADTRNCRTVFCFAVMAEILF